jgi:hypothetical protein
MYIFTYKILAKFKNKGRDVTSKVNIKYMRI